MNRNIERHGECEYRILIIGVADLLGCLMVAVPASATQPSCTVAATNAMHVPNLTITMATDVPAANGVPEYCNLIGTVATNGEGGGPGTAGFELEFPATWNEKFLFLGGGGFDGTLPAATSEELIKGYATVSTNSGHSTPAGSLTGHALDDNPSFAVISSGVSNAPALVDYFYRARHQVAVATKLLVLAYYGAHTITHSYFSGCSNGGHEGFVEAIRYPDDFEGIISGDPWINQPGNQEWSLRNMKALLTQGWIPYSAGPALSAAVYANCDALDGVMDGLIQNPAKCSFDPNSLVPGTLTQAQANALRLYLDAVRDDHGNIVFPGATVSDIGLVAAGRTTASTGIFANEVNTPAPFPSGPQPWGNLDASATLWPLTDGVMAYLGYYEPSLNLISNLVVNDQGIVNDQANTFLYRMLSPGLATDPSLLLPFISRGHKLLIYDGFSDPVLDPYETIQIYNELAKQLGGYDEAQKDVRLFMVPGMQHCAGGSGPNNFDTLTALEKWIEMGQAPDGIIATHYVNNIRTNPIDRTMPLCKFPEQAHYNGTGDVDQAASWSCPPNNRSLLEIGPNGRQAGLDY